MVVASLLPYLRDRSRTTALIAALAAVLIVLGLLAFVALLGAVTADNSVVEGRLVGPFRWWPIDGGAA